MNLGALSGLSALYPGYLQGQQQGAQADIAQAQAQAAQNQLAGQQAYGRALQAMFGGQQMPAPPMPGQPSVPASPMAPGPQQGPQMPQSGPPMPQGAPPMPQGMPPAPGASPPMRPAGPGAGQPPIQISPMGGQQQGMGSQPQGQPTGSLDWRVIIQSVSRANPGAPPQVIASAVDQFVPMMNMESRLQWQQMKMQLQLEMKEQQLQQAWQIAQMRFGGPGGGPEMRGAAPEQLAKVGWDQATIDAAAETYNLTGKMPTNLGTRQYAGLISGAIQKRASEMLQEQGISPADRAANWQRYAGDTQYQRSAGGFGARVEAASNEVAQAIPQALEASKKVPRGNWVPLNSLFQQWQAGSSDPAYNDFIGANFALINAYQRAMNPTGNPRIAERIEREQLGILKTAISQQAYEVQVRRLWKEVQGSKKAIEETRKGRTGGDINAPLPGSTGAETENDPLGIR